MQYGFLMTKITYFLYEPYLNKIVFQIDLKGL